MKDKETNSNTIKSLKDLKTIVLASNSPARRQVLENLGLKVIVKPTNAEETYHNTEPGLIVEELAKLKLDSYLQTNTSEDFVLACDTLISFQNNLLGKPKDENDARKMLESLSSQTHQVYSGYALKLKDKIFYGFDKTDVVFKNLSKEMINEYLETKEYVGAAGAYRIQGFASKFIDRIEGDIDTIIGIPTQVLNEVVNKHLSEI